MGWAQGPDCLCCDSSPCATLGKVLHCTPTGQTQQTFGKWTDAPLGYWWLNIVFTRISGPNPPFTQPSTGTYSSEGYMLQYVSEDTDFFYFERPASLGYPLMTAKANKSSPVSVSGTCPTRRAEYRIELLTIDDGSNGSVSFNWFSGSSSYLTCAPTASPLIGCTRFAVTSYLLPWAVRSAPTSIEINLPTITNPGVIDPCNSTSCCADLDGAYTLDLLSATGQRDGYYFNVSYSKDTNTTRCCSPNPAATMFHQFTMTARSTFNADCDEYGGKSSTFTARTVHVSANYDGG